MGISIFPQLPQRDNLLYFQIHLSRQPNPVFNNRHMSSNNSRIPLYSLFIAIIGVLVALFAWLLPQSPRPPNDSQALAQAEANATNTPSNVQENLAPSAMRDQAFTFYHDQGYEAALELFDLCIEKYGTYGDCYHGKAMALRELGDFSNALMHHAKAIETNEIRFDYYLERGSTYLRMADFEKALGDYKQCLKRNPNSADCHNTLGMTYRGMGRYQQAIIHHDTAIQLNESRWDFFWERGVTYQSMGEEAKAILDFEAAKSLGYE